jgi:DNA polymerase-3 subunit gamma/tau
MQRFDFRRIGPGIIAGRLREVARLESIEIGEDALALIARVALGGMRDALSLVDQAVAFGEGPVTAVRVRTALGLIGDELYAELLEIVAERRSADVLPFVARLVDAGADLAEFAGGLGEVLRALLQQRLGSAPEGLTDVLHAAVVRRAAGWSAGDVVRMLKLLAEAEENIRRSPHARLHVETLLLQLTLLDRTVELAEVLRAVGGGVGGAGGVLPPPPARAAVAPAPAPPAPPPSASAAPAAPGPAAPPASGAAPAPSQPDVVRRWLEIVEAVGQKSRVLREALAHAVPVAEGEAVALEVSGSEVHLQGLENGRKAIEAAVRAVTGTSLRVVVRPCGSGAEGVAGGEPKRLSRDLEREERLQRYRAKDPGLDATADALDLELLE